MTTADALPAPLDDDEMTISVDERKAAMTRVMVLLAELFRDARRDSPFEDNDVLSAEPLQTTLYELQGKGWVHVQEYFGGRDYVLMKLGWFEAQRISGYFEIPEGMERLSRLLAALKDAVKGRREKALVECEEIALAANLPEEWVRNMVESQALACLHPERSYWLSVDDGLIAVPPTFGQEIVEL